MLRHTVRPVKATQRTRELVEGFLRAAIVGVGGGMVAVAFRAAAAAVQSWIGVGEDVIEGARHLEWWKVLLIPTAGMLVAAAIVRWLARRPAGFADVMEAVSVKRGPVSFRSMVGRGLASLSVIATGGSVGREGPIIGISAAIASNVTRFLKTPMRDRGLLLGCGVAAGFASAYNAPIAGAIFALEVVLGNFAMELFAPVVVASVTATLFTRKLIGEDPLYAELPTFHLQSPAEAIPYVVLGVLAGFVAVGFQGALRTAERGFRALRLPRAGTMALGGLLIGALALGFPEVWGNGHRAVLEILTRSGPRFEHRDWSEIALFMLAICGVKIVGTAITVGSGGSGGVFTPSLFVGAALGAGFGVVVHQFAPQATGDYGGYALVGMGCLVAGTTRAPIMAIFVVIEMTALHYDIVLALMLGCITSTLVARTLYPNSIYTEELVQRGTAPPQGLEETVLVTTRVEDVMRTTPTWVSPRTTYGEIIPLVTASRASMVNVCGEDMRYLGVIRVHDVIDLLTMGDLGPGIVAADFMSPVDPVTRDEPLASVFEAFDRNDLDELPIVDGLETRCLVGVVTRRDVMAALHMEVLKRQNLRAKFVHREDERAQTDYVELPKGVELARVPAHPAHFDKTLGETAMRTAHKLTILSVVRHDPEGRELRILPDGQMTLKKGDELIVIGASDDIRRWRAQVGDL